MNKSLVALGMAVLSFGASAAVVITPITDVLADVATVGTAVFGVYVAIKAVKFVRRAL